MDIDDLRLLETGPKGTICVVPNAVALFLQVERNEVSANDRQAQGVRRVRALMRAGCENGLAKLNPEKQLRFEDRFPDGGEPPKDVGIYAFKGDQFRAYGGYINRGSGICFVVTEIDETKKNDKAQRAKLKLAAKVLGDCIRAGDVKRADPTAKWLPKRIGEV